jgi:hypothetical protein
MRMQNAIQIEKKCGLSRSVGADDRNFLTGKDLGGDSA